MKKTILFSMTVLVIMSMFLSACFTVNRADVGDRKRVFNQPFFIILNLAVGSQLPGMVGLDTAFPAQSLVDYVRVYNKAP